MKIELILDDIQELVERAKTVPLSGKKVIESERLLELIDELRTNMPKEVQQAKNIAAESNNIIESAKQEAERIVQQAEERARMMIEQNEITRQAQQRAGEIIGKANGEASKIRQAADNYIESIMKKADDQLSENLAELKKTRQQLKNYRKRSSGQSTADEDDNAEQIQE